MSVINQMLQDLDARRAEDQRKGLPNEVRPLPGRNRNSETPWLGLSLVLLAAAGLGGGAWYYLGAPGGFASLPSGGAAASAVAGPGQVAAPAAVPALVAAPAAASAIAVPPTAGVATPPLLFKEDDFPASLRLSDILSGSPSRSSAGRDSRPAPAAVPASPAPNTVASSGPATVNGPIGKVSEGVLAGQAAPRVAEAPGATVASAAPTTAPVPSGPVRIEKTPMQPSSQERAEAEYRRGVAAINQGALKEGADALRQTLKLDGQHAAARQLLLRLLLEQRNQDEARSLLEEAARLQPGRYQWALALARLQVERGDASAAWQALQGSMAAGAGNADYQGLSGNVLQRLGRHRESAEHYRAALRIAPGEGRWWLGLGLALEADGNAAEARQAFLSARSSGSLTADMVAFVDQRLR